ncbi:glycosyltransferase family A protein [Nocardioides sp. C4-1]|uniref:glycosyltransferase n=1 Tax=Nocardioides sp. C4-1 TaxID=3151851 RepID=UPI0032657C9C
MSRPPDRIETLHVVVPVHDEVELLPACLDSLAAAVEHLRTTMPSVRVTTTVVLDACTDESFAVCRGRDLEVVEVAHRNVGAARAAGIEWARSREQGGVVPSERTWVFSTDADSIVLPDVLTDQVCQADSGADVVLGRVEPDATAPKIVLDRWHVAHDDGRVGVHGAHLGFRLSSYDAVGGFAALGEREDLDLVRRLLADGARAGAARSIIATSSRLRGRTPGGFAGYLAGLVDLAPSPGPPVGTAPQA